MPVKEYVSKIVPALILLALLVLVVYTIQPRSVARAPASKVSEKGIALVESARIVRGDLEPLFSALGSIEPLQRAEVFSVVTGRLDQVSVNEGDHVEVGDVLAVMNADQVAAELQEVEAELELVRAMSASIAGVPDADASPNGSLRALRIKQLQFRQARLQHELHDYVLRAPISGIVTRACCIPGDTVAKVGTAAASEALFVIEEIDSIYARAGIPEKFLSRIYVGMKARARVGAYPLEHFPLAIFHGRVATISPTVDAQTRTVDVRVEIDNREHKLRPGMSVEVGLVIERYQNVLLVPKEAVVKGEFRDTEADLVYVIEDPEAIARGKPSRVVARGVNLGLSDGVNYIIAETGRAGAQERQTSWVTEGNLVVTVGAASLVDDQFVRVVR